MVRPATTLPRAPRPKRAPFTATGPVATNLPADPSPRSWRRRLVLSLLRWGFIAAVWGILAVVVAVLWLARDIPPTGGRT